MNIGYQPLILPPNIVTFVREIRNGAAVQPIPLGWEGIVIYHPATNQFYSTKSKQPIRYEEIIRTKDARSYPSVALVLRRLMDIDPNYQFFVLHVNARAEVETWFVQQGKRRVATRMGEAAKVKHVMFRVTSLYNKFTRYVVAPSTATKEELIETANKGIASWLKSKSPAYKHERGTMQIALRSRMKVNEQVFEPESEVFIDNNLNGLAHNQYRNFCMGRNIASIRDFILATTGAK